MEKETAGKSNGVEEFEKRWFCVAICHDGSVFMDDADSPASFLEVLPNAIIAWIDYRTAIRISKKMLASLPPNSASVTRSFHR